MGIAASDAFVGNLQTADCLIWSAIGNTTNLAARLQQLMRELNTSIAIDQSTWSTLGAGGVDFHKHVAMSIRGQRGRQDAYVYGD